MEREDGEEMKRVRKTFEHDSCRGPNHDAEHAPQRDGCDKQASLLSGTIAWLISGWSREAGPFCCFQDDVGFA